MKTAKKQSNRNEFSSISARIDDLIGVSAITSHLCSTTPSRRNKQAKELQRRTQSMPRLWNETLAFTADG